MALLSIVQYPGAFSITAEYVTSMPNPNDDVPFPMASGSIQCVSTPLPTFCLSGKQLV